MLRPVQAAMEEVVELGAGGWPARLGEDRLAAAAGALAIEGLARTAFRMVVLVSPVNSSRFPSNQLPVPRAAGTSGPRMPLDVIEPAMQVAELPGEVRPQRIVVRRGRPARHSMARRTTVLHQRWTPGEGIGHSQGEFAQCAQVPPLRPRASGNEAIGVEADNVVVDHIIAGGLVELGPVRPCMARKRRVSSRISQLVGRRCSGQPAARHMSVRFSMAPRRRMGCPGS
jgi:hypothetical protein